MSKNRWDKLTSKYAKDPGITSEEVKKFLEMNFVNEYHDQLAGKKEEKRTNPALIMDLRHDLIKRRKEKTPQSSTAKTTTTTTTTSKYKLQKELNMENIRNHNNLVDSRMIENELEKFKLDIRKLSVPGSRKSTAKYKDSLDSETGDEDEEEAKLLSALRDTENASFAYRSNDSNRIIVETSKHISRVNHFEFSYDEGSHFSGSTATISEDSLERTSNLNFIKVTAQPKALLDVAKKEYEEYYEVDEEINNYNEQKVYDPMCYMCFDDVDQCDFKKPEYDTQSFFSMPNLSDNDVENLMKITKFQSLVTVEGSGLNDCPCCPPANRTEKKIKEIDRSIEEAEAERLLIIRRMELEEKNYQELVIKSNAQSKNISDPKASSYECERIISDILTETEELSKQRSHNRELVRKSFKDWLQKTTVSKILKTNAFSNEDRVKKINDFLNKIRFEQNRVVQHTKKGKSESGVVTKYKKTSPSGSKTLRKDFENKLKVQQDIIELQKLKIQRQERLITEMKLAKFTEMVRESKNDLKMELINVKRGNAKLRAKARCIEMVANIPPDPIEEERRKLLAQGLMMPKFLQKMQERAAERLTRHEEARERRARLEHEKEEAKTAAEIAKRLEDEEAKRKRFLEMREKRRQEKFAKQLREQERVQYFENLKIARDHYAKKLLKRIGFRGFELLVKLKRANHKKSTIHRRRVCMRKIFSLWHSNAKVVWDRKRAQAGKSYTLSLYRMCIRQWRHVHSIHQSKFLVAIDWYEIKITEKLFRRWTLFTQNCKMIEGNKMRNAEAHYNCQMKWKLFECWHRFPALMKIERETDIRRQKWRMKIWDLLPDYKPQDAPP